MRLVHSITMASFVTMVASLSACSSDPDDDGKSSTGGSGGTSPTGGTAGAAGSGTSGTAGSGTSGAAGSGTSGTGGGGAADHPTDTTQAGIEAFLMGESYKTTGMGWRPESTPSTNMSVHGAVRRYFNETIIASKAAGNAPPTMQHTAGSMSIKEILTGGNVVGKAAMLRTDSNMWVYYCTSTEAGRCYTGSTAGTYYGTAAGSCSCHGSGVNLSSMAIPAP